MVFATKLDRVMPRRGRDLGTIGRARCRNWEKRWIPLSPLFDAVYDRAVVESVEPIEYHHVSLVLGELVPALPLDVPNCQSVIPFLPADQGSTGNSRGRSGHEQSSPVRGLSRGSRRLQLVQVKFALREPLQGAIRG